MLSVLEVRAEIFVLAAQEKQAAKPADDNTPGSYRKTIQYRVKKQSCFNGILLRRDNPPSELLHPSTSLMIRMHPWA